MSKKKYKPGVGGMQLPLMPPESSWRAPRLSELPQDWNSAGRIGFDLETRDEEIKSLGPGARRPDCYMVGFSFAFEDGPSWYVPLRHQGGDNVEDVEQALNYLRHQTRNYRGTVVGANISYDLDYLAEEGGWFDNAERIRDIQVADPLIYELHLSYSLKEIAKRYNTSGKDQTLLEEAARSYGVDPKGGLWRLPARFVGPYASRDAEEPLRILRRQERLIEEGNLWDIYNLESDVTPVLVKMRRRGVRIDTLHLEKMENWSLDEEAKSLAEVKRLTGYDVGVGNVWKADVMAEPLRRIGVDIPVTAQDKVSVKKDFLDDIDHPVAKHLAWARKTNKLRTTFASSVWRHMVNGRIHCIFNQIAIDDGTTGNTKGVRYGRLSCELPNLQQQPARESFSKDWRKIYLPEEGQLWCSNDYSQQEPRWTTHFSEAYPFDEAHIRASAFKAAQTYRDDPNADNHDMMTRIVYGDEAVSQMDKKLYKSSRTRCKIIYLGLCYGEGGPKLCHDLGLSTRWAVAWRERGERHMSYYETEDEARQFARQMERPFVWQVAGEEGQAILDQFNGNAPHISALAKGATKKAEQTGFVRTIKGRRLHFPIGSDGKYMQTHKALNRIIQGSSADQTKTALVLLDRAGSFTQLQVHDEITSSVKDEIEGRAQADIMRECLTARVPFKVDTEIGASWGDSMG